MIEWIKAKGRFLWSHRTKCVGIATGVGGGIEHLLAQYGHALSDEWRGILLGIAGMITFLVGLYNSLAE